MKQNVCRGKNKDQQCKDYLQKWSYAIPLEIIYLTPLNKWNPYNLTHKGNARSQLGKTVNANGRNGGLTKRTAFNGTNSKIYYITPDEFFSGSETQKDAADTTRGSVGVLDPTGEVRSVRASGIRIFLPNIPGVGILRQRYPIFPIHAEGSTVWKELEATKDFLMQSNTHARLFREKLASGTAGVSTPEKNTDTRFLTGSSRRPEIVPNHVHELILTTEEIALLKSRKIVSKTTGTTEAHQHEITIGWNATRKLFYIASCQGTPPNAGKYRMCFDKHTIFLKEVPDQ